MEVELMFEPGDALDKILNFLYRDGHCKYWTFRPANTET